MKKRLKYGILFMIISTFVIFISIFVARQFMPDLFEGVNLVISQEQLAKQADEFNYCEIAADCAWGQITTCSCRMGGQMAPLNKNKLPDLDDIRKRFVKGTQVCPALYMCDHYQRDLHCVNKKCI